jgi:conjugative transfer signal peptidase TraF
MTGSMKNGAYWLRPGAIPKKGDVVLACIPQPYAKWAADEDLLLHSGQCDGIETILKRVVAVAGDRVRIGADGIAVNGRLVPATGRANFFRRNPRPEGKVAIPRVPDMDRTLVGREVMLVGDNRAESFDSRYFGPTTVVLGTASIIGL